MTNLIFDVPSNILTSSAVGAIASDPIKDSTKPAMPLHNFSSTKIPKSEQKKISILYNNANAIQPIISQIPLAQETIPQVYQTTDN